MPLTIAMSIALVLLTTGIHLVFFSTIARAGNPRAQISDLRFYYLMLGIFGVHLIDIALYAFAYYLASDVFGIGALEGSPSEGALGHFYASAVIYTTLGFGDVLPQGHIRCLVATESLNGLLFIAWSASFMFAAMGRTLQQPEADPRRPARES